MNKKMYTPVYDIDNESVRVLETRSIDIGDRQSIEEVLRKAVYSKFLVLLVCRIEDILAILEDSFELLIYIEYKDRLLIK